MREVTVSTFISAPREEVFDFVCDLAGRPAYTDHYLHDYRLARANPVGVGAAARFRLEAPLAKEYAELQIKEADRPRRIVEELRVGRRGRNRSLAVYEFTPEGGGVTRVELTTFSEPATIVDRLKEIEEGARAAANDLRGAAEGAAEAGDHRRLRAGEGAALRGLDGHGPGARPAPLGTTRLPGPMDVLRRRLALALCLLGLAAAVAACGEEEPGFDEPAREGLAIGLDGIDYNVFITRQLNPAIPPDDTYYAGGEPDPDETLYGVFIQACNNSDRPRETAEDFRVVDNQGNEFEPEQENAGEVIAYEPRELEPEECIPEAGSLAQLGPEAASMLLFRLPVEVTENRPLELEIEGEGDEHLTFELDL
jgi:uncharacterized protein YndB with AHSA1/START domain